ncbi:MAG: glycosyltransferase family 2 protein [Chitinophagaceae bacterium]|nr:glycosyltransferase family 2 protein [Chitinophagaceae bacterium]
MPAQPSIALVLLNYNGKEYLERNLPFIKKTLYKNKIIYVIDNNSGDDSVSYLCSHHPDVVLIKNSKNLGYASGYNFGLSRIEAEYFILLNTDVEVTENFIEPVIHLMETDKNIGVCQPKILSLSQKTYFEYAGGAGGWMDIMGYTFARGRIFDEYEQDIGQFNDNREIFWASGACMIIRASLFKKLGGFYEYFFMYYEEVDLCWRVHAAGYTVASCGQAVIFHKETDRLLYQSPERLYYLFRNNLIMLHRNLPISSAFWTVPARLMLNIVALFYFIVKGHLKISLRAAVAQIDYLKWALLNKDLPTANNKKSLFQITSVYKGSILYQFYILGKKKFNDIVKF